MSTHLFIRHGESELNIRPDIIVGRSNHIGLTERGERQARLLGIALRQQLAETPTLVFHSGAIRAAQTAHLALTAAELTMHATEDNRLLEVDQGPNTGRLRDEIYTPETIARLENADIYGKLPGTESVADAQERMYDALREQHLRDPDGISLSFGHGFAIRCLAGKLLGLKKAAILELVTSNVSVTAISVTGGSERVEYVGKRLIDE